MSQSTSENHSPPNKHTGIKIVLLILLIGSLLFAAYFFSLTFRIGQELAQGTYDLSSFAVDGQTTYDGEGGAAEIADPFINNFADDPVIGPDDAPITIVAFEDFQCPFSSAAFPAVRSMLNRYGDKVRFVYRDFPISSIHPNARKAAEAASCAKDQGQFLPYHDRLYQNQDNLDVPSLKRYAQELNLDTQVFDNCLDSGKYADEVEADLQDGISAGVTGTPTFFVNENMVPGVINDDGFDQIIDFFGG